MSALFVLALLQAQAPTLAAAVDRDRVSVGEDVTFSVTAVSRGSTPMQLTVAPSPGFAVMARTERSEVGYAGGPSRSTTLEIRLRALRAGHWLLGPVDGRQGSDTVSADAIAVDVVESAGGLATAVNPGLRQLLARAPPPSGGRVAVTLSLSSDTVRVGEQVDLVATAWFPRDLRLQLRRTPVLLPPVVAAVWSYAQPAPPGVVASRRVGDEWYDLFVAHQVIFPLVSGWVPIPSAVLRYSVPVALQFFSQEERYNLVSEPARLTVLPLPDLHRPPGSADAVASGLRVERSVTSAEARAGEALQVAVTLSGQGNLALWPAPDAQWPAGVRAYADRTDERVTMVAGRLGGDKVFRYIVVPPAGGTLVLPPIAYPYFDLGTGDYAVAGAPATRVGVAAAGEAASARALPPDLLRPGRAPLAVLAARAVPGWGWPLLLLLPPLGALLARRPRRRRTTASRPRPAPTLAEAEHRLEAAVRGIVADPAHREGRHLGQALRAVGVHPPLAARAVALRERLLARRYGPAGAPADPALLTEADEVAGLLGVTGRRRAGLGTAGVVGVVLLATAVLGAQAPSPERLYESGALRAAATGFLRRAVAEPEDPANWYALGAARYRMGDDGAAAVAWLRAERRAPRDATIRRALRLAPPPDDGSATRRWTPPVMAIELVWTAEAAWLLGWLLLGWRRRAGWALIVVAALAGAGALAIDRWLASPLLLSLGATALRISPHGRADVVGRVESGSALRPMVRRAGWLLVRGADGAVGWIPIAAVGAVAGGGGA